MPKIAIKSFLLTLALVAHGAQEGIQGAIPVSHYQNKVQEIVGKIPEFRWLAKTAQEYGLQVWLFGGSAASFAHYVKESILLEQGSDEYYQESFRENAAGERHYTDIFRPTQDIDLVVDGEMASVRAFERATLQRYPDIQGGKPRWEVRTLRENYRDKLALLNNPDFFDQHTDSHSVGLIALDPTTGKGEMIRDLLDWDSPEPHFLQDVLSGSLHYDYNKNHRRTARYKKGFNPEIFSVIRYFTKLFQFELTMGDGDREHLQLVISQFSADSMQNHYVRKWLEGNVPKLFLHSRNVEYAWNVLEEIGLRTKLMEVGNIRAAGSPAWWMNKSPLRSFELGRGKGQTARELGIKTVAHDTKDFFIWSVITRSRKGEANIFASRRETVGERAYHGDGFYTISNSRVGLWGTGYSIGFRMDPEARQGSDFTTFGNMVLVLNRKALKVIPESLTVENLVSYFYLLQKQKQGDRGILDKIRTQMDHKYSDPSSMDGDELKEIFKLIRESKQPIIRAQWLSLKISSFYPELFKEILKMESMESDEFVNYIILEGYLDTGKAHLVEIMIDNLRDSLLENLIYRVLSQPGWEDHPHLIEKLLAKDSHGIHIAIVRAVLTKDQWSHRVDLVETLIAKSKDSMIISELVTHVLSQPKWGKYPHLVEIIVQQEYYMGILLPLLRDVLSEDHWRHRIDKMPVIERMIQKSYWTEALEIIVEDILTQPGWGKYPHLVEMILAKGNVGALHSIVAYLLPQDQWRSHLHLIEMTIAKAPTERMLENLATYVLSHPDMAQHTYILEMLLEKGGQHVLMSVVRHILPNFNQTGSFMLVKKLINQYYYLDWVQEAIQENIIDKKHWSHHPQLADDLVDGQSKKLTWPLAKTMIPQHKWGHHLNLVVKLVENGSQNDLLMISRLILPLQAWHHRLDLVEKTLARGNWNVLNNLVRFVLSKPHWSRHPHLVEKLLTMKGPLLGDKFQGFRLRWLIKSHLLAQPYWANNPRLIEIAGGAVSPRALLRSLHHFQRCQ